MTLSPLSRLLSQALVAYTVELDNEAEHRLPHRTTRGRTGAVVARGPRLWLVSYSVSANVLQYLEAAPLTVAELRALARTDELLLHGLRRWGYVTIEAPPGEGIRTPPHAHALVRLTEAGAGAQEVWRNLPPVIDERWRTRFGAGPVAELEQAARAVFSQLPYDPPAYLPVIHPAKGGRAQAPPPATPASAGAAVTTPQHAATPAPGTATAPGAPPLSALLSGVLLAYTLDAEALTKIPLPIGANTLRAIDGDGTRPRDLPGHTGVSKEANAMALGWLERHGCAASGPDPAASRGQLVTLTAKGASARRKFEAALHATDDAWRSRFGADPVGALRRALVAVVGDGTIPSSPLTPGLEPYPDGWRAGVRAPRTLPHYPMVLHRGGYPDGS